jgi:hypothetical protein
MNTNKFIAGGIVAGVVYFFLGYLFYGLIFKSFFDQNGFPVDMSKMIWWALIVASLAAGFLIAYVLNKAGAVTVGRGLVIGFVVGLLMELNIDYTQYAIGQTITKEGFVLDLIITAVIVAVAGAVVGWIYGMKKKEKAAA